MIKNRKLLEKFDREEQRKQRYFYQDSLKIFEALWQEAKDLGVLPLKNPLEGIESDLRIATALNYKDKRCLKRYYSK